MSFLYIVSVDAKWHNHLKRVRQFLIELTIHLTYHPTIPLLAIHPRELKIYVYTKTCIQIFIEVIFIVGKDWRQPSCPSVGKGLYKMPASHTMIQYSAVKGKTAFHATN